MAQALCTSRHCRAGLQPRASVHGARAAPCAARAPHLGRFDWRSCRRIRAAPAEALGIFYSTTTGNTEEVADMIKAELYSSFKAAGATMVGRWPTDGYEHRESKADMGDGFFCGLPLDQDNQDDLTEGRVKGWAAQVLQEMSVNVVA